MWYISNNENFSKLKEFQKVDIDEVDRLTGEEVVVILDSENNFEFIKIYTAVKKILINKNKVVFIYSEENKYWKIIALIFILYENYNIYKLEDIAELNNEYIKELFKRNATPEEVRTFITPELISIEKLDEILLQLKNLITAGELQKAVEITAEYADVLESSIEALNWLKTQADGLLQQKINTQSEELEKAKVEIEMYKAELEEIIRERKEIQAQNDELLKEITDLKNAHTPKEDTEKLKKEIKTLKKKLEILEEQASSSEPVISTYAEVQTALVKCRVKSIIYFKEISYVKYMNSLVIKLFKIIADFYKVKAKLLIYDNKNDFLQIYKPLNVIGSKEYAANREQIVTQLEKVVIVEANPAIIEDIIKTDYDVIILYDRMKRAADIVSGNNIYKYWVINSIKEFSILMQGSKIDKSQAILGKYAYKENLFIPDLGEQYEGNTESARTSMYMNAEHPYYKKSLLDLIIEKAKIEEIARIKERG